MNKQHLLDMIDAAENGYEYYEPLFQELSDYYLSQMNPELYEELRKKNKSRLFFPRINSKVKRIVSSFQEAYFSTDTFAKLHADDDENAEKVQMLQKALDHYTQKRMTPLFVTFAPTFYAAPIFGTVIARVYWGKGKPVIENVHIRDIKFDPSARTVEDIRFYVHDIYLTVDDIKSYQQKGVYRRDIDAEEMVKDDREFITNSHSRIKLQEVYTINAKGEWTVSTFYDKSYALRKGVVLKDGNPFIVGFLVPQIEQPIDENIVRVYGDPAIAPIVALQNELNIRRNQQIDAVKKQLDPQFLLPSNAKVNPLDIEKGARFIRTTATGNAPIIPVPAPNISSSSYDVENIDRDMSENFGVSAQQNGIGTDTKQTATESSILSNEGNARMQAYMRSFNETFFKLIFKRTARLVWKYGDPRFFPGVSRTEQFEFVARINTGLGATNKEVQLAGIERSAGMVSRLFEMAMATQNVEEAGRAYNAMKKLTRDALPIMGIEDTDEYLGEEDNEPELGQNHGAGGADAIGWVGHPGGGTSGEAGNPLQIGYRP
ncbi:hypothetical protein WCX49_11775 [Sulfurimonas sp. HSL-1656]|uniref:portal protein n=1 Tax=Thiomicrolovo subterrani TaxID=3131934 RepID=UPI0031F7E1BE